VTRGELLGGPNVDDEGRIAAVDLREQRGRSDRLGIAGHAVEHTRFTRADWLERDVDQPRIAWTIATTTGPQIVRTMLPIAYGTV
jgi:hypothetical protein